MPITEFLNNLRFASQFALAREDEGTSPPPVDRVEEARKYSDLWLTPDSVKGFDPHDFVSLSADEKRSLERHVEQFVRVARAVPSGAQPTPEQVLAARASLVAIHKVMKRYLYDQQSMEVINALNQARAEWLPDFVVRFDVRLGEDSTGDPAVWVSFVVADEAAETDRVLQSLPLLRKHIYELLDAKGIDRIVYLDFRTVSESRELLQGVPE